MTIGDNGVGRQGVSRAAQLAQELETEILTGLRPRGQRLPSVRSLAKELDLAPNTVHAAYKMLTQRGLIEGRGRAGTVVTGESMTTPLARQAPSAGLIDLSTGQPDLELLPPVGDHLRVAADRGDRTPATYGCAVTAPELEAAVRDRWGNAPIGSQLLAVPGAMSGLSLALASLRPGDRVGIEDPGYGPVRATIAARRLHPVPLAIDGQGVIPGGLAKALTSGMKAVMLTPRAQNPTGAAHSAERASALAEVLFGHPEVLIVEDDHAGEVAGSPYHGVADELASQPFRSWLLIRSLSKSYGPDLRLAIATGDATTMARIHQQLTITIGWVPYLVQYTAASLLTDAEARATVQAAARVYASRRAVFVRAATEAGLGSRISAPRSGFNVWVHVEDEAGVVAAMERAGFAIAAGASFRLDSEPGVRISVAAQDPATLRAAAIALANALNRGSSVRLG